MIPSRLQIKYFVEDASGVDLGAFIGIFQRWIQVHALGEQELLIDAVDYRHVFEGPGVVLIGHESDFALDRGNGRLGLLYTRKRQSSASLAEQLRASFGVALAAAQLIEADPALKGKLRFNTNAVEIRLLDRLQLPNRPETLDLVRDDVQAVLAAVYGSAAFALRAEAGDRREPFTVVASVENATAPGVAALQGQFKAAEQLANK